MSFWTLGLNQSVKGTWNTNALINLHLATGAVARPGCGAFSLTGQPNAMGGTGSRLSLRRFTRPTVRNQRG